MNSIEDISPHERVIAFLLATYVANIIDIEQSVTYEALADTLAMEPEEVLDALEYAHALQEYGRKQKAEESST
jgi:predicted amino acid-binding ACT domain protein